MIRDQEIQSWAEELDRLEPEQILRFAFEKFPEIKLALSGVESSVLIDMAVAIRPDVRVFTLDTGRLHAETYRFIDAFRRRYHLELEVYSPNAADVQELVRKKGLFSFYADGHEECCSIRKVEPLRRALFGVDAWITGQRRDQSVTRDRLKVIERDHNLSTPENPVMKLNPVAGWSMAQVWSYVRAHSVPFNELYARGFMSIGCEPCTRAIPPGEHERAGRWWWEDPNKKECGIHANGRSYSRR